jgi:hypothetical protein
MSIGNPNIDSFDAGRRHALAAVRASIAEGIWTPQERTVLRKRAVRLRQLHLCQAYQRAYYAGLISVLKSRLSAKFPSVALHSPEYETGWDWDGDEDNQGG